MNVAATKIKVILRATRHATREVHKDQDMTLVSVRALSNEVTQNISYGNRKKVLFAGSGGIAAKSQYWASSQLLRHQTRSVIKLVCVTLLRVNASCTNDLGVRETVSQLPHTTVVGAVQHQHSHILNQWRWFPDVSSTRPQPAPWKLTTADLSSHTRL